MPAHKLALLAALASFLFSAPTRGNVFLEVEAPAQGTAPPSVIGWTEVRGFAWTGDSPFLDVVIAIDLSRSTLLASGSDVNGNGRAGRIQPEAYEIFSGILSEPYSPSYLSTDRGDTVALAQLAAARRFVESLSARRTRVGVVTFDRAARVRVPLAASRDAALAEIARLERLERRRAREFGGAGTNLADALATAGAELLYLNPRQARREVLALTDGMPDPPVEPAAKLAAAVAWELSERGVGVHLVPLGIVALKNAPYFDFVAELTGDSNTAVVFSGEIVEKLRQARAQPQLAGLDDRRVVNVLALVQFGDAPGRADIRQPPRREALRKAGDPLPAAGDGEQFAVQALVPVPGQAGLGEGEVEGDPMAVPLGLGQRAVDVEDDGFGRHRLPLPT